MVLTVGDVMGALSRGILCLMGRRRVERSLGSGTFLSFLRGLLPVVSLILLVVFMGGVLSSPADAAELVSNLDKTSSLSFSISNNDTLLAQKFTVGDSDYLLETVVIQFNTYSNSRKPLVSIHKASGIPIPTDKLYDLTETASQTGNLRNFTAPTNATLKSGTEYFLVLSGQSNTASSSFSWRATGSDAEDSGAASGWSIGNKNHRSDNGGTSWISNPTQKMKFAVHGSIPNPVVKLIGNLDQSNNDLGAWVSNRNRFAQEFTTGSNSPGYYIDKIAINVQDASSTCNPRLSVYTIDSGEPGTKVFNITGSVTSTGKQNFTAPDGAFLNASTSYMFYAQGSGSDCGRLTSFTIGGTSSSDHDPNPFPGWSIENSFLLSTSGGSSWDLYDYSVKLAVHGLLRAANSAATGKPVITGTVRVGETLTADTSGIDDSNGISGSFAYQWIRVDADGNAETDITGATDRTYAVVAADGVKKLKVRVSFTDDQDYAEGPLVSDATGLVKLETGNSPAVGKPVITDTFKAGEILTANTSGIYDADGIPNSFNYQWVRVDGGTGTDIPGETGSTYTVVSDDVDKEFKVRVSFTDNGGFAEGPLVSDAVLITPAILVSNLDKGLSVTGDTISNSRFVAQRFTTGNHSNGYDLTGLTVNILTGSSTREPAFGIYTSTNGSRPDLKVYGFDGSVSSSGNIDFSAPVGAALKPDTDYFVVFAGGDGTGSFELRHGLGSERGFDTALSLPGWSIARSKLVSSNSGGSWTSRTQFLPRHRLFGVPRSTPLTNFIASGQPVITGTAAVGKILTADVSGILDQDGLPNSFSYQWIRVDDGVETDISGETGSTYTVVSDDVNLPLKVGVSFTDDSGFDEGPLVSDATDLVEPVILVSNLDRGLSVTGDAITGSNVIAQKFTTGNHSNGYDLTGLTVNILTGSSTREPAFGIYTSTNGSRPDVKVYGFDGSVSSSGKVNFSAPVGAALKPDTDYFLYFAGGDGTGSFELRHGLGPERGFDTALSLPGWSIARSKLASSNSGGSWSSRTSFLPRHRLFGAPRFTPLTNFIASGQPVITGTLAVSQILTADVSGIADQDGLPNSFSYQWVVVDGGDEEDISGATGSTYTPVQGDVGKRLKVKVSFTDDAGSAEGPLVSDVTTIIHRYAVLVSNLNYSPAGTFSVGRSFNGASPTAYAQSFTTGNYDENYVFSGVTISVAESSTSYLPLVAVYTSSNSDRPDTKLYDLNGSVRSTGEQFFAAPAGAVLNLSTKYFLRVAVNTSMTLIGGFEINNTNSDGESSDSALGWSIGDGILTSANNGGTWITDPKALHIRVHGYKSAVNNPPYFTSGSSFSVNENTASVGTVEADDPDVGDSVTGYGVAGGDDAALFSITSGGVLSFNSVPDFERPSDAGADSGYVVVVEATSGTGTERTATQTVTVTVTDVTEVPSRPSAPSVSGASTSSLSVSWSAPSNTGPFISGYDVQYRQGTTGAFGSWSHSGNGTSATITGLNENTAYDVQVLARNAEGDSNWSLSGSGTTLSTNATNNPPVISSSQFTVGENLNVVGGIVASDPDAGDDVTGYEILDSYDVSFFNITDGGVLSFVSAPDYEDPQGSSGNIYIIEVEVTSGTGARVMTVQKNVIVVVFDVRYELPFAPEPVLISPSDTFLVVNWSEPSNFGPVITGYDVQYKENTSNSFLNWTHDSTATTARITTLSVGTVYDVRVRAVNDEGEGNWSEVSSATTVAVPNVPPEFSSSSIFSVEENVLSVDTVVADDADALDGVTGYVVSGGVDSGRFSITSGGVLSFVSAPDFEVPLDSDADNDYVVIVEATSGSGSRELTATQTITVTVTDVTEVPSRPSAPTLSSPSSTSLSVSWSVPSNAGPVISGYDVEFRQGTSGSFSNWAHAGKSTSTTITGLSASTLYEVRILARNDEGDGGWSETANATTVAVPNVPPEFSSSSIFSVEENVLSVDTVVADDADALDDVTGYAVSGGVDSGRFSITSGGVLSFVSAPDFEVPADSDGDNEYVVVVDVKVTSGAGSRELFATQTITVTVVNVDEAPSAPSAPVLSSPSSTSLRVAWSLPGNTGPAIIDYDVGYGVNSGGPFTDWPHSDASRSAVITGLSAGTLYYVRVRAVNAEGDGGWSEVSNATTVAVPNVPPEFSSSSIFSVEENVLSVDTVVADDADALDDVTGYAVSGGVDSGRFSITDDGVLSFVSAPDFEVPLDSDTDNEYVVVVKVTSGAGSRELFATQTITVTVVNVDEAPSAPSAPVLSSPSSTSLRVAWSLPGNTGPAIIDYDVGYGVNSGGPFTDWPHSDASRSAVITGLSAGTLYYVRVRAVNAEGDGGWSETANATTVAVPNVPPEFSSSSIFSVEENVLSVDTVVADDADALDDVTGYAVSGGVDSGRFSITSGGVLSFVSVPDFEVPADSDGDNEYVVVVKVTSGAGSRELFATQTITVTVVNVDEAPSAPSAPVLSSPSSTSLLVSWSAPSNTGPSIVDYDVGYGLNSNGPFTDWPHSGASRSAVITGLNASTLYFVRVLARNAEGDGGWSETANATTVAVPNVPPEFSSSSIFSVEENVLSVDTVVADDADALDDVTGYAVSGGVDSGRFSITSGGVLSFVSVPDFEVPADSDGDNEYVVVVEATSGAGSRVKTATQTITVTVVNVDEVPSAPSAPTLSSPSSSSLSVSWSAPSNTGPVITDYAVEFRQGTSGPFINWVHTGNSTSTTITSLNSNTLYEVQVLARNAEGDSNWSLSGSGRTQSTVTPPTNTDPVFTSSSSFPVNENSVSVGIVAASDSDGGDSVTGYRVSGGADSALFTISNGGILRFRSAPDFETPLDSNRDNDYVVVVEATSGTGSRVRTAVQTITVTVNDVNEDSVTPPGEVILVYNCG